MSKKNEVILSMGLELKTCKAGLHTYTGRRCLECRKAYNAKRYVDHKSESDKRVKQWINDHPEYRQKQHEWYIANKDVAKARATQWTKDHPEQHNLNQKRSRMGISKKRGGI